jgi:hypothetical protein
MGWDSVTTVHVGAAADVAVVFELYTNANDDEDATLPEDMDNTALLRPHVRACTHFSARGTCPYGRGCHFVHHAYVLHERAREAARAVAEEKLKQVAYCQSVRMDHSDLLWDVVEKRLVPRCPSYLHDDCEGTDWVHVADPAAHAAAFHEKAAAPLDSFPVDIVNRIYWCLEEARCSDTAQMGLRNPALNVDALKSLLRSGSVCELEQELHRTTEALRAEMEALANPTCTCGAERARVEAGEEEEEEGFSDSGELMHERCCPCWDPDSEPPDYDDEFGSYAAYGRNVRQRTSYNNPCNDPCRSAYEARTDRMQALQHALGRLDEAADLNSFEFVDKGGEPSIMSIEELQAMGEEVLASRRQGIGSALPPLDVSACTTRSDFVAAFERAQVLNLTEYEKMRFAFSVAAERGEHIIIRHDVC